MHVFTNQIDAAILIINFNLRNDTYDNPQCYCRLGRSQIDTCGQWITIVTSENDRAMTEKCAAQRLRHSVNTFLCDGL